MQHSSGLRRCIIEFWGRCSHSTGPNHSLSTYFLPRIEWLQDGSQILFGKVCNDCVYILIDTSHSMKGKLDLVKDKITQFIQVRWSYHLCKALMHLHWSSPAMVMGGSQVRFALKNPQESHVRKKLLSLVRVLPVFLCKQNFLWQVLSVTHRLLTEFLCPLLQVLSVLKSVACIHLHGFRL